LYQHIKKGFEAHKPNTQASLCYNTQVRLKAKLSCEEYISSKAWLNENLLHCPIHPQGNCGFSRLGKYERKFPSGLYIQRWRCLKKHITFSLIPDFAASHVPATLSEIETAVVQFNNLIEAGMSRELAARNLRPDIEPAGALRWIRRRIRWIETAIVTFAGLAPVLLTGIKLEIPELRHALNVDCVLVHMREIAYAQLQYFPTPVGFAHLQKTKITIKKRFPHKMGPDPP
jgi:transposase-like protein